jgi:hypothetical protein
MTCLSDSIVGHKTFDDGEGGFRHEPLYASEAEELLAKMEAYQPHTPIFRMKAEEL